MSINKETNISGFVMSEMGTIKPQERIKQLTNYGNNVDIDVNVPIRRYYRSGMEMVRMASVYFQEGNLENAYTLYFKFMVIFLEKILTHPEYKQVPANMKRANQEKLKEILPLTEKLKLKLLDRYTAEYTQFLALKERERVALAAIAAKKKPINDINNKFNENIDSIGSGGGGGVGLGGGDRLNFNKLQINDDSTLDLPTAPHDDLLDQVVYPNDFPTTNKKSNLPEGLLLPESSKSPNISKPSFDRNLKPSISHSDSLIEGNLRTIMIPGNTMEKFLNLANKNTSNNIETCGILAGHLAHNQLIITNVIVPKQNGTSDSCTTMNEEDIFDIQDQNNLITLGWIHTHPSQTAFLSSVDLHTHCSYQIMMPEALAIVCAPKYQTTGFFCLTPGYGLEYIAQCRQSGFHPHPNDPPLFMEARHFIIDKNINIEVIDLRNR